jgi:two-component system cell cycle sensor histidine kinase/response regulator CckA
MLTDPRIRRTGSLREGRHGTVLVVDDEPAMLGLLRLVLGGEGFTVIQAHGAAQAMEVAARHAGPIHLLLTDTNLPPLSGRQLAERLRAARPAVRVLYMTTDPVPKDLGVNVVTRPLGVSALVRRVRELLRASLADLPAEH